MYQQKLTLHEFLAWEQTQPIRHEFYRGEIFAMEGNTASHNRVVLNVAVFISEQADLSVHQVFCQGMRVHVDDGSFYPDIVVTSGMDPAGDEQVVRDPTVIIEVLSSSTDGYDQRGKLDLYRTLASVRELAIVEVDTRKLALATRQGDGSWHIVDQTGTRQLVLSSIDVAVPADEIFKGVAPS